MVNGGLALPRIRVRSRRRKPRGPQWLRKAMWCFLFPFLMAANMLSGHLPTATAMAVFFVMDWRELHRFPCDPEATPLTLREREIGAAVRIAACALSIVGAFL